MQLLLPNLALLRCQLEGGIASDKFKDIYYHLEQLPYSLGSTYNALFEYIRAERELLANSIKAGEDNVITAVGPGGRDKLAYKIDSFLESARRTQNAVPLYISKALSISLPASLPDVIKSINAKKVKLSEKLTFDLLGYWENQGKKLKAYRDLSQHHALVASEVRMFVAPNGPAIYLALPKNPEVKSPSKLDFSDPPIQAFYYMREQLDWLIQFCHEVTSTLTKPPSGPNRQASSTIVFRNTLSLGGQLVGHTAISDEMLESQIAALVSTLKRI